jgi:hypothetical protein
MMALAPKQAGNTRAKDRFPRAQGGLLQGWQKHYPGMVKWVGSKIHEGVKSFGLATNTVASDFETYRCRIGQRHPGADGVKMARHAASPTRAASAPSIHPP